MENKWNIAVDGLADAIKRRGKTTRYQKSQIEDVAGIIHDSIHQTLEGYPFNWVERFADLFAADNPKRCTFHGDHNIGYSVDCKITGFNRERFLAACGLEREG